MIEAEERICLSRSGDHQLVAARPDTPALVHVCRRDREMHEVSRRILSVLLREMEVR